MADVVEGDPGVDPGGVVLAEAGLHVGHDLGGDAGARDQVHALAEGGLVWLVGVLESSIMALLNRVKAN